MQQIKPFIITFALILGLVTVTAAHAREPIRVVATDSAGKEIFAVEQAYNGKRQKTRTPNPPATRIGLRLIFTKSPTKT